MTKEDIRILKKAVNILKHPSYLTLDMYEWLLREGFHPDETILEVSRMVNAIEEYHRGN